jgi:LysR family transcriptional regulator, hydrogen peroxide-inducible genes activator
VFLPYAEQILSQSKQASARIRQLETGIQGPLRVGVIPTVLPYFLAPRLPDFSRQYPQVDLMLTEDLTEKLVESLQAGDLDVVLVSLPIRHPDAICSELFREPLVLVVPKDHKLAESALVSGVDLSGEPLLLLKEGHCFREDMLTACKRNRAEMAPIFESDHFGTIFPLVAAGAGITIAPKMAALQAKDCSIVPLGNDQSRRVGYARLKSSASFRPLKAFTKWLRTSSTEIANTAR